MGSPLGGSNYFSSLTMDIQEGDFKTVPIGKRKRKDQMPIDPSNLFPELPTCNTKKIPEETKFIILKAINDERKLRDYNLILINKYIEQVTKKFNANYNNEGNLIIEMPNKTTAEKLLGEKILGDIKVCGSYMNTLNQSQGMVFARELNSLTDEEIIEALQEKNQNIVKIYRFKQRVSEENRNPGYTGTMCITFDQKEVPEYIKLCFLKLKVRKYYPNPKRCTNCQRLNHTKNFCKYIIPNCVNCGEPKQKEDISEHTKECTLKSCINCKTLRLDAEHPANAKECEAYRQEKEIIKIKIDKRVSRREAIRIFRNLPVQTKSYAETMKTKSNTKENTNDNLNINSNTNKEKTQDKPVQAVIENNTCTNNLKKNEQNKTEQKQQKELIFYPELYKPKPNTGKKEIKPKKNSKPNSKKANKIEKASLITDTENKHINENKTSTIQQALEEHMKVIKNKMLTQTTQNEEDI